MSVRAGFRNPYTQPQDDDEIVREKTRTSLASRELGSDDDFDRRLSVLAPFDPAKFKKKKRACSLAERKDVKNALRSFKSLLKPGSKSQTRYGIMVSKTKT